MRITIEIVTPDENEWQHIAALNLIDGIAGRVDHGVRAGTMSLDVAAGTWVVTDDTVFSPAMVETVGRVLRG